MRCIIGRTSGSVAGYVAVASPNAPCQLTSCLAGCEGCLQSRDMKRKSGDQGTLFGPATPTQSALRRRPLKQTEVSISADAIVAATVGQIDGERVIAEAVRRADGRAQCRRGSRHDPMDQPEN